jgi:hypothetical protein
MIYVPEYKSKRLVLQCINGASSNSVQGEPKIVSSKSYSKTVGFNFQMYIFRTSKMCTITPQNNNIFFYL